MFNTDVLWFFLLPLALSLITFAATVKRISLKDALTLSWAPLLISVLIISVGFALSVGFQSYDHQLINGEVAAKERKHDQYTEYYSCNCKSVQSCSTDSKGSRSCSSTQVCDTCSREHYTVAWNIFSTVGDFQVDKEDWTNTRVYKLPDPPRYTVTKVGDPASVSKGYTNYIKAVPESIFKPLDTQGRLKWEPFIPEYPQIHDIYKVNRVITVGVNLPDLAQWNNDLSNILKVTGPAKQANIILIITNIKDPSYFYAVQDAWVNAKKNDIVVIVGAADFNTKIDWVKSMAYTENELLHVKLRDDLLDLTTINKDTVLASINTNVKKFHSRKPMASFEYLKAEIDPPEWVLYVIIISIVLIYIGVYFYYVKHLK